jgi:hypothetical protein
MFIAVIFQVNRSAPSGTTPIVHSSFTGETLQEAATRADDVAEQYRRSNNGIIWIVKVGELTHEVATPERKVNLVRINKNL